MSDAQGHTTSFGYDARHNLTRTVNARTYTTTYKYDQHNNLNVITDALDNKVVNTYDVDYGDLLSTTDQLTRTTYYAYNAFGQRTAITDALDYETTFDYDDLGRLITTTHWSPGRQRALAVTVNTYDHRGDLVQITHNYTATTATPNYLGLWNLTTRYAYDAAGNQVVVTDTLGRETRVDYDAANRVITTTQNYTTAGGVDYQATYNLVTQYGYDALGNQAAVTETVLSDGTVVTGSRVTRTFYDELSRPVETVVNYRDGVYDPSRPDEDVLTHYGYPSTALRTGDAAGNLITTTDTLNRVTVNAYDALNRLVTTTVNFTTTPGADLDTYNLKTHYEYDEVGNLVRSTDPQGRVTLNAYDALNRLISTTVNFTETPGADPDTYNLVTRYGYDAAGNRTAVTDTLGHASHYAYDALDRLVTTTVNFTTTPGADPNTYNLTTTQRYDVRGNRDQVRVWTGAGWQVTRYAYDVLSRLVEVQDAEGSVTRYAYDVLGNRTAITQAVGTEIEQVTRYAYDALGRLVTTTDDLGGATALTYDPYGNPIKETDARGNIVGVEYDPLNRPLRQVSLAGLDGAILAQDVFTAATSWTALSGDWAIDDGAYRQSNLNTLNDYGDFSLFAGLPVTDFVATVDLKIQQVGDPYALAGLVLRRSGDGEQGLMAAVRTSNAESWPSGIWEKTSGEWSSPHIKAAVPLFAQVGTWQRLAVVARGSVVVLLLDGAPIASWEGVTRTEGGGIGLITFYADVSFDNFQVRTLDGYQETRYTYDGLGNQVASGKFAIEPGGNHGTRDTQYAYDSLNRLVALTDPLDHTTRYAYPSTTLRTGDALGQRTVITDAEGIVTRYEYDAAGRLAAVVENYTGGQATEERDVRTTYGYDALGHRTHVTNALGYTSVYTYDALGRLTAEHDPLTHTTRYAYDALNNRTVTTQAVGTADETVTRYAYDEVGRLLQVTYPQATVRYRYDAAGKRVAMTDTLGATHYEYDALYRLVWVTDPYSQVVEYAYDAVSNRTVLTYPHEAGSLAGQVVTYTYDGLNRLVQVEDWDGGRTRYGYDETGRLISTTLRPGPGQALPNGVQTTYGYDDADRLTLIEHRGAGGALLARYVYELDAVGNRTRAIEFTMPAGEGGVAGLGGGVEVVALPGGLSAEEVVAQVVGKQTPGLARETAWSGPVPSWAGPVLAFLAAGGDVTITSDTTWYSDTVEIGNLSITNNAELTLAGASGTHLTVDDLSITGGAGLVVSGTAIITASNVTLEAGASLSADGLGYGASQGPGQGTDGVTAYEQAGGGGHGGWGGDGSGGYAGGQPYDDVYEPQAMGSGGGNTDSSSGGAGGGAFQLVVSGTLTLSGSLSADGLAGDSGSSRAGGGGAGGSIWVEAGTFTGNGVVRADGGDGGETNYDNAYGRGGGGAGGRVAVYADSNSFTGALQAQGGDGNQAGGAGTVYARGASGLGALYVDNGEEPGASAGLLAGAYEFEDLQLTGAGDLTVISATSVLTLSNGAFGGDGSGRLTVQGTIAAPASFVISGTLLAVQGRLSGATAVTTTGGGGLELWASTPWHTGVYTLASLYVGTSTTLRLVPHVTANGVFSDDLGVELQLEHMTVASGGLVEADGLGYGASEGPGAGTDGTGPFHQAGGGGHGGAGGDGTGGHAGGQSYDDAEAPLMMGSGGGDTGDSPGGAGGGAFQLVVSGTLAVSGTLSADGLAGASGNYRAGGGGAGGSIWIEAGTFTGNGVLRADGDDGGGTKYSNAYGRGGGGGGGRIAVYASSNVFTSTGGTLSVAGGDGYESGETGTIYASGTTGSPVTVTANFTATPLSGYAPLTVTFSNLSTSSGTIDAYAWDFGDGNGSTLENPTHTYTQTGVFTVILTATAGSESDAEVKTDYITVAAPLTVTANFTATPLGGASPLTVTFSNLSTSSGTIDAYAWDFGDGHGSTLENPTHVYTQAGSFTVVLTATAGGESDVEVKTDYISVTTPISGLSATNDSPTALGESTTLTATVTSGSGVAYAWAFGDGDTGSGAVLSHPYPALGVYTAVVTASNSVGVFTATTTVTITDAPISGLSASNDSPTTLGESTALTATITGGSNVSYAWAFGDGSNGSGPLASHTYPDSGLYTAVVTASNSVSVFTATTTVTITDVPVSGLSASNDSPTALGEATALTATVTGGSNVSYAWVFGDGDTGSGPLTSHTYPGGGLYTAVVTASNGTNALTTTTPVTIVALDFVADPRFGAAPLTVTFTNTSQGPSGAATYLWRFGDGSTALTTATAHPTHTYTQTGLYTVSLRVTDGAFTHVQTKTHYISVGDVQVIAYEYDDLYRLVDADYASGEYFAYTYDAVGNRTTYTATITQTTVITYEYDAADRLLNAGGVAYTWDDLGRLLDDGTRTYAWDAAGRLITVTLGDATTRFEYNGDGDRLSKAVNGTLTTYTLDVAAGLPQVLVERSGANGTRYLYGLDLVGEQGTAWAYHLGDGLGSVRQLVDEAGQVTLAQGSRPFGAPLWQVGSGRSGFGFTGEQVDASTGLVFLRARYYAPGSGRFLSLDSWSGTIWQPGTLNKYNYVGGNPIGNVDPSGRQSECPSHHNTTSRCHPPDPEPMFPPYDPLPPHLWYLSKEKARLFQIPVELVAGTIATEIVHDTDWDDPVLDDWLERALYVHYCPRDGTWGQDLAKNLMDEFLTGYEHYWSYAGSRGPGPGVANVHVGTAKATEEYFSTHYPSRHLLDPPPDLYARLADLLQDDTNVHYTAAILRRLADLRKGENGEPLKRPHLHDLDDWDMQIIYGAFRAGIKPWGEGYASTDQFQRAVLPGSFGRQIAPYLRLYRELSLLESI